MLAMLLLRRALTDHRLVTRSAHILSRRLALPLSGRASLQQQFQHSSGRAPGATTVPRAGPGGSVPAMKEASAQPANGANADALDNQNKRKRGEPRGDGRVWGSSGGIACRQAAVHGSLAFYSCVLLKLPALESLSQVQVWAHRP